MPTALQALSLMKGRFSWIIYDAGAIHFPFFRLATPALNCLEVVEII